MRGRLEAFLLVLVVGLIPLAFVVGVFVGQGDGCRAVCRQLMGPDAAGEYTGRMDNQHRCDCYKEKTITVESYDFPYHVWDRVQAHE